MRLFFGGIIACMGALLIVAAVPFFALAEGVCPGIMREINARRNEQTGEGSALYKSDKAIGPLDREEQLRVLSFLWSKYVTQPQIKEAQEAQAAQNAKGMN